MSPLNAAIVIVTAALIGITIAVQFQTLAASSNRRALCNCVAFRIDDIQAFWIRSSQQAVVKTFNSSDTPVTVGIIGFAFDADKNNTQFFKHTNIEMANHGWRHENFANLTLVKQSDLMNRTNQELRQLYGRLPQVFIAPDNAIDSDTIEAARENGFKVVSSYIDKQKFGNSSGVMEIPGTIYAGYQSNAEPTSWTSFNSDSILNNIEVSIQDHGYAVVVLHPQVFFDGKGPNKAQLDQLSDLINRVKESHIQIVTLSKIY